MPYIIETFDKPEYEHVRQEQRNAHLQYLNENIDVLLACGAKLNPDGSDAGGSLYIVDFESEDDARAFIDADPFTAAGLFERIIITRWRKGYVDGRCYL